MHVRHTRRSAALLVVALSFQQVSAADFAAAPGGTGPAFEQVLRRGQGLVVRSGAGSATRAQVVDPAEPVRVIVEFDAEPVATARLRALDADSPRRLVSRLRADLATLAARAGVPLRAEVTQEYTQVYSGAALVLDRALLERVRALPYVRAVFPDDTVRTCDAPGNALVGADRVRTELGGTGAGVRIGIIDTGIDYDHAAFGGGFGPGHRVAGGYDFANHDPDPRDDHGHGTHVAGIAAGNGGGVEGAATQATLYAFKVLNSGGYGYDSDILAAFERVLDPDGDPGTDDTLDVINCSFGASGGGPDWPTSVALDRLTELGVVCVAAAGNDHAAFTVGAPGSSRAAITVGASDLTDQVADFSSRGPARGTLQVKPDLVAPGVDVLSAALGGGTVAMSGTSMATPLVAGVAAQLLQLHPGWSPAAVKAALTGGARDLGQPAFAQGAGRLQAYASARATFAVTPTALSFGLDDASAPVWTRDDTLRVTNLTAYPMTVRLSPTVQLRAGAVLTAAVDTVRVAANATGAVPVRLVVDNSLVPYPPERPCGYGAVLLAWSGTESHRVPVTFHKGARLRVREAAPAPPGHYLSSMFVLEEAGTAALYDPFRDTLPEVVPPGRYSYVAAYYPFDLFLARDGIPVAGDAVIALDPAEATMHVTFAHVDASGAPVEHARGSVTFQHPGRDFSYSAIGFPLDQLDMTPAPAGFSVQWSRFVSDDRSSWVSFAGDLAGASQSFVISNQPSDLRHIRLHYPEPPLPSVIPIIWDYHGFGSDGTYFGLGFANDQMPPVTGPFTFDWWGTPTAGLGLAYKGIAIDEYEWDGTFPMSLFGKQRARFGPRLQLERGWPVWMAPYVMFHEGAVPFSGEHLRAGATQPVWRGAFQNSQGTVQLYADAPLYYRGLHLVTDAYGSAALEPDPVATLSRSGSLLYSGPVQGAGDFLMWAPWSQSVGSGPVTFRTSVPYTLGGQPASLAVSAYMNTDLADPNPPALGAFYLFADGAAADTIDFARSESAGVRFRFVDRDSAFGATLAVRPTGTSVLSPLPVTRDGDSYVGQLPPGRSGLQDLVLLSVDASGNATSMEWTPAYFSMPAPALSFGNGRATLEPAGVRLEWDVQGGAGLRFSVDRSEDATAWGALGHATADGSGLLAYVDSTAEAGHLYVYRAALPSGGTPAYSAQVTFRMSGAPALAFGSTGPNPLTGPSLAVQFTLPVSGPAQLGLYDVSGRRIVETEVGTLGAGTHQVALTLPAGQRPGMCFLQLRQGGESTTRRVCVLR